MTVADLPVILSVLLAGVAIVLAFIPRTEAVAVAFVALLCGGLCGEAPLVTGTLVFWLVASLIAIGIQVMLPTAVRTARTGVAFFATGALAGAVVGMAMHSQAAVIVASAAGVFFGALAVSRLRAGRVLEFPSSRFFNYLLAKGLPMVVAFSMLGILSLHIMAMGVR